MSGRVIKPWEWRVPEDEPLFIISVAARLVGLHEQTLRLYEKKGLVVPHRTDRQTRLYSARDIRKLWLIKYLVQVKGFNLASVKFYLEHVGDLDEAFRELQEE